MHRCLSKFSSAASLAAALHVDAATAIAQDSTPVPRVPGAVEPGVRAALEAAWLDLPAAWRRRIEQVRVVRQPRPAVPDGVVLPLATRLLLAGAHAEYRTGPHCVVIFDAALGDGPVWRDPPPNEAELAAFFESIAPALDLPAEWSAEAAGAVPAAWERFAARVAAWPEAADLALDPGAPVGAPEFLTGFLRAAVTRTLGGSTPPLRQMIVHEFAHAVQLEGESYAARMGSWGAVSDWRRSADGLPAQGMYGGGFRMEDPVVLIRALFGGTRGPSAAYRPSDTARFANPYMAYDLREDFAEAVRLAMFEPDTLLERAPAKLLAVNAIARHGTGAGTGEPELIRSPEWLLAPERRAAVVEGLRRIVAPRAEEPAWDPGLARAVLHAHLRVWKGLQPAELPVVTGETSDPNDVPEVLNRRAGFGQSEGIVVHGRELRPPARSTARALATVIRLHDESVGFDTDVWHLLIDDDESAAKVVKSDVDAQQDPFERLFELRALWPHLRRVWPAPRCAELARREIAWHRRHAEPGSDELVAAFTGVESGPSSEPPRAAEWPPWLRAEHAAWRLEQELAAGLPPDDALAWAQRVSELPGNCWAARLRVRLLLAAAKASATPERRAGWIQRAREAARQAALRGLAAELAREVDRVAGQVAGK